jgi:hypothetical protein
MIEGSSSGRFRRKAKDSGAENVTISFQAGK